MFKAHTVITISSLGTKNKLAGELNSPGQATKRKRGLLRKPGPLPHTQRGLPPGLSFCLYVAQLTHPMHVTLCPQTKAKSAQAERNSYLKRSRLCSCE